jgi:GNAT superfamily N-acetyltransferase
MRIRTYRREDLPTLVYLYQLAIQTDQLALESEAVFVDWLSDPAHEPTANVFVIRDDDDELNTWGQAGTLDGIEGEVVGFTAIELIEDEHAYHFRCIGTVHPQHRRRNAGRLLLVGALNRARLVATEFESEAEQAGLPIYFEALLPVHDPGSSYLAAKCDMLPTDDPVPSGLRLYRREVW